MSRFSGPGSGGSGSAIHPLPVLPMLTAHLTHAAAPLPWAAHHPQQQQQHVVLPPQPNASRRDADGADGTADGGAPANRRLSTCIQDALLQQYRAKYGATATAQPPPSPHEQRATQPATTGLWLDAPAPHAAQAQHTNDALRDVNQLLAHAARNCSSDPSAGVITATARAPGPAPAAAAAALPSAAPPPPQLQRIKTSGPAFGMSMSAADAAPSCMAGATADPNRPTSATARLGRQEAEEVDEPQDVLNLLLLGDDESRGGPEQQQQRAQRQRAWRQHGGVSGQGSAAAGKRAPEGSQGGGSKGSLSVSELMVLLRQAAGGGGGGSGNGSGSGNGAVAAAAPPPASRMPEEQAPAVPADSLTAGLQISAAAALSGSPGAAKAPPCGLRPAGAAASGGKAAAAAAAGTPPAAGDGWVRCGGAAGCETPGEGSARALSAMPSAMTSLDAPCLLSGTEDEPTPLACAVGDFTPARDSPTLADTTPSASTAEECRSTTPAACNRCVTPGTPAHSLCASPARWGTGGHLTLPCAMWALCAPPQVRHARGAAVGAAAAERVQLWRRGAGLRD